MKNPMELFPPYRKWKDKQRDDEKAYRARIKIEDNLHRLWNKLVKFEWNSYIDLASLEDLSITYEDLTFNDDGLYETTPNPNFFKPSTKEYLEGLPPDRNDSKTEFMLKGYHKTWTNDSPLKLFPRWSVDSEYLCYRLRDWFQYMCRKGQGEDESMCLSDPSYSKQRLCSYVTATWNNIFLLPYIQLLTTLRAI